MYLYQTQIFCSNTRHDCIVMERHSDMKIECTNRLAFICISSSAKGFLDILQKDYNFSPLLPSLVPLEEREI